MKPSWIVFDIGGVILDWQSCREATLNKLNITLDEFNPVFLKYLPQMESGSITPEFGFSSMISDLNLEFDGEEIYSFWQSHLRPIVPTFELIKELSRKYLLAICSNTWINALKKYNIPKYPGIFSFFEVMVDSSEIKTTKPSINIYKMVEAKTGATGQKIFFIDDSVVNINGVKSLNWQTFLFNSKNDNGVESCQRLSEMLLDSK